VCSIILSCFKIPNKTGPDVSNKIQKGGSGLLSSIENYGIFTSSFIALLIARWEEKTVSTIVISFYLMRRVIIQLKVLAQQDACRITWV
jgi:hypothetical protein